MQNWIGTMQWCIGLAVLLLGLSTPAFAESWVLWERKDLKTRFSTSGVFYSKDACLAAAPETFHRIWEQQPVLLGEVVPGFGDRPIERCYGERWLPPTMVWCWPVGVTPQ